MKNTVLAIMMLLPLSLAAQDNITQLWQRMPDGIVPLLSKTNRLDMIDFCENNMEARVSNILDGNSTMDTLTSDYLRVTLSSQTMLEMKLVGDSIITVNTAAALSSTITIYNKEWQVKGSMPMPTVREFLPNDVQPRLVQALETVPLITARLSAQDATITYTLHPDDLSRDERREVEPLLHTVTCTLTQP